MEELTVKELAEELGITPQGLNNYLRKSGLQSEAVKDGNRFLIPEKLAEKIRKHFRVNKKNRKESEIENDSLEPNTGASDEAQELAIPALIKQLEILQKQLEIKDKQIETLTDALANANEANRALSVASAMTTAAEKKELLLTPVESEGTEVKQEEAPQPKEEKKKGFLARLFGWD